MFAPSIGPRNPGNERCKGSSSQSDWAPSHPAVTSDIFDPLTARSHMQEGNATGDSLMRMLLTTDVIQASVAEQLLGKLADDDMDQNLASLILSQFRW